MYLRLVVLMIEALVVYNILLTNSAELIKSTASVDVSATNVNMTTSFPEFSHKEAWVTARPKLIKEHFGNNEDMLFSYRETSEQVDPGLQPFTNLKPQRKLSEILFGLLVFEKLNSQTIIPPSFGWTSLICLFHIQKQQQKQQL